MLERTVKFQTTVDVVLEEYSNCLPNNKWSGVTCFDSIWVNVCYVKGALLIISSTSNNTVCSSSKWLQKK